MFIFSKKRIKIKIKNKLIIVGAGNGVILS
jgi:hypothetical protein